MPSSSRSLTFSLQGEILGGESSSELFFFAKYSDACGSVKKKIVLAHRS